MLCGMEYRNSQEERHSLSFAEQNRLFSLPHRCTAIRMIFSQSAVRWCFLQMNERKRDDVGTVPYTPSAKVAFQRSTESK